MALKTTLVKGLKEQEKFDEEQSELKEKYHVAESDKDIIIVEKSNMGKFLIRMGIRLFHFLFTFMLVLLAAIGLVSLVYPSTRLALWDTAIDIYNQFLALFQ